MLFFQECGLKTVMKMTMKIISDRGLANPRTSVHPLDLWREAYNRLARRKRNLKVSFDYQMNIISKSVYITF